MIDSDKCMVRSLAVDAQVKTLHDAYSRHGSSRVKKLRTMYFRTRHVYPHIVQQQGSVKVRYFLGGELKKTYRIAIFLFHLSDALPHIEHGSGLVL